MPVHSSLLCKSYFLDFPIDLFWAESNWQKFTKVWSPKAGCSISPRALWRVPRAEGLISLIFWDTLLKHQSGIVYLLLSSFLPWWQHCWYSQLLIPDSSQTFFHSDVSTVSSSLFTQQSIHCHTCICPYSDWLFILPSGSSSVLQFNHDLLDASLIAVIPR